MRSLKDLPRVDIVYAYAGADGTLFEALIAKGVKGIVYAGLPSGIPPPAQRAAMVEAIRRGVLIVHSRRSPGGRLRMRTRDADTGIVIADNLNPQKARVLAMVALATTDDKHEIRRIFEEY